MSPPIIQLRLYGDTTDLKITFGYSDVHTVQLSTQHSSGFIHKFSLPCKVPI